jgi:tetratricopeptide (TPR) repeat protein
MQGSVNLFGQIVLFSAIPLILVLFAQLPPRRAVIAATIISWLFLPNAGYSLPGLPDYTKTSATTVGALLGAILFDFPRVVQFRPKWYDLPIFLWCAGYVLTSLSNDLGFYDGLSGAVKVAILWGIPYFLGRIYLSDLEGLRDLAFGIVLGAAVYAPLCLWENRMSPTLNLYCYGVNSYYEHVRFGFGYRPIVFMTTGLEVGVWMGAGTVCSYAFWRSGAIPRLWGFKFVWFVAAISISTLLTKSVGAIILAVIGVAMIELIRRTKRSAILWILILTPPIYMTVRTTGLWDGQSLVALTAEYLPERINSVEVRINSENMLATKALERPILGWGGYSRNFVTNKQGRALAITDGYWILILGMQGLFGLSAMTASFLIPQILFFRRIPGPLWSRPEVAGAVALCLQIGLYMIDNLSNAMPNPAYAIALGGLAGLSVAGLPSSRHDAAQRLTEAEALKEIDQPEAAEAVFAQAIESYIAAGPETRKNPKALAEIAYAYEALADLYASSLERPVDAELSLLRAIEIHELLAAADPERSEGYERLAVDLEHLGRLQSAQGRFAEAESTWSRALEFRQALATHFPGEARWTKVWAESLNDLAWMLACRADPKSARTAVDFAARAIELEPTRSGFLNTLGLASYHAGDYPTADAALRRSVELGDGGTGYDHYLLAMTSARLGNMDQALESFEHANAWTQSNAPDHPVLAQLRDQAAALLHA